MHTQRSSICTIGHCSPKDPHTWPLVRSVKLKNGKDYRKSKTPSPFVAYDVTLLADMIMH